MKIALLNPDKTHVIDVRDIDQAWWDKAVEAKNPKLEFMRPAIDAAKPTPGVNQVVEFDSWIITDKEATRTWKLVDDLAAIEAAEKAAKRTETDAAVTQIESVLKTWESADEKSKGEVLHKLLYLIIELLRGLGTPVTPIEKPAETIKQ